MTSSVPFGMSLYVPREGGQPSSLNRSPFKSVSSEIQLRHHSTLMIETTTAIAAAGLPQKEILGPLCTRKQLQHCACWIGLKDDNTILILFLQQFSPTLSSTMKYPTPHRQYKTWGLSHSLHSSKTDFQPPHHKWSLSTRHNLISIYILASPLGIWCSTYYKIRS